jgi:uncharacterized membrane protein YtjA (UPF0391 family)
MIRLILVFLTLALLFGVLGFGSLLTADLEKACRLLSLIFFLFMIISVVLDRVRSHG